MLNYGHMTARKTVIILGILFALLPRMTFAATFNLECPCVEKQADCESLTVGELTLVPKDCNEIAKVKGEAVAVCEAACKANSTKKTLCTSLSVRVPDKCAAGGGTITEGKKTTRLTNPLGTESIPELVGNIINALLGFIGAVALLMFVYGGLLWLTSGGSADKVNKGKQVMAWAAIGLVIIFSSYGLVRLVFSAFTK